MSNGIAEFPAPSLEAQIEAAKREVGMRQDVYPRLVASGKMKQAKADYEIQCMQAIVESLVQMDVDE